MRLCKLAEKMKRMQEKDKKVTTHTQRGQSRSKCEREHFLLPIVTSRKMVLMDRIKKMRVSTKEKKLGCLHVKFGIYSVKVGGLSRCAQITARDLILEIFKERIGNLNLVSPIEVHVVQKVKFCRQLCYQDKQL